MNFRNQFLQSGVSQLGRVILVSSLVAIGACTGDTDGGPANDLLGPGDQLVSDGGFGATIKIDAPRELGVGEIEGFSVTLKDPNGQPLQFVRVFCESEKGIAIIEPSSGGVAFESTSSTGFMSGKIGGLTPGSYIMECRAPNGYNLKARAEVKVTGDVPQGFEGFPGAAGGNLGGGFLVDDTLDVDSDGALSVTAITFTDAGGASASGPIDTSQTADCDTSTTVLDVEPFSYTAYSVSVKNLLTESATIKSVKFTVSDGAGGATSTQSKNVPIAAGATASATGIFIDFTGGSQSFAGTSNSVTNGTFRYTATVVVETLSGESVTITARGTVTFGAVNNCS